MAQGGGEATNPGDIEAVCLTASELLKTGQVAEAAVVLSRAEAASVQSGQQMLAHALATVCRACLAYTQCRVEVDWYRRMYVQAAQREQDALQGLGEVLDLIARHETRKALAALPALPEANLPLERFPPTPPLRNGVWARLRALFGRKSRPRAPAVEIPADWAESRQQTIPEQVGPETVHAIGRAARSESGPAHEQAAERPGEGEGVSEPGARLPAATAAQDRSSPSLVIYGLGPFRVYQDDRLIEEWASLKARSILKYLVMHRGAPVLKDVLMDLFWPEADPQAARRNLHQAIYSLRRTLRRDSSDLGHIRFEDDCYSLNPALDLWVDWVEFESRAQAGRELERAGRRDEAMGQYGVAESLYQGDFLEEDLYEDWTMKRRERLRRAYCELAERLSVYHLGKGEYHAAVSLCQKILGLDDCYEQAHRCLMRCYLAQGQRHLAVRQYQVCVETLRRELDLVPSRETVDLYATITGIP